MKHDLADAILCLIAEQPGIRAVEIAAAVHCKVEEVEQWILDDLRSGVIARDIVQGPNGRSTCAYRMGGPPVKWGIAA